MTMDFVMALFLGIGLSATCGFRVFVPLLGLSIAAQAGYVDLSSGFGWIGSWPATIAFAVATVIEIGAYFIPWLDNLLDTIATPAAVVAGTMVTASVIGEMAPLLRWTLAIVAGGGIAGIIQSSTVMVRGTSTATTAGVANPAVSAGELGASVVGTIVSIIVPVVAVILVAIILFFIMRQIRRLGRRRSGQGCG
jgi:hypothetical protein